MDVGYAYRCTCPIDQPGSLICIFCGGLPRGSLGLDAYSSSWSIRHVPRLTIATLVGALTGAFAIGGAFLGAIAGGLAGRASDRGLLRGSVLGAIAGTILSLEILEALRAYWCLGQTGQRGTSSLVEFVEELLRGRFVQDQFEPALLTAYNWQLSIDTRRYEEMYDSYDKFSSGLSPDSLKKLPHHVISEGAKVGQSDCCAICLQNLETGEIARSLPRCRHMFHLTCVDKWLTRRDSCPVCRQYVKVQ